MSPLDVATAYAVLANGGFSVEPYLIQRIDDLRGATVYEAQPLTVCRECEHDKIADDEEAELSMDQIMRPGATQQAHRQRRVLWKSA